MGKKELGNKIFGTIKKTANRVKTVTSDVLVPEVTKAAKKASDTIKEKRMEDSMVTVSSTQAISPINAVKVCYYLMACDGNIAEEENEKFDWIGQELDSQFSEHREQILRECKERLEKVIDTEDYYDAIENGVDEALLTEQKANSGFVLPKLLLWNLLSISYSDKECHENERKLMKYIVRKLNIEKSVLSEMENSFLTIKDLEKESEWIKNTNRPFLTIESQVKEIEKREQVIFESTKILIYV